MPPFVNRQSSFVNRRTALALGSIGLLGFLASRRSALAQASFSPAAAERDLLVVIFLRGGADGLNIVPPHGEDAYHRLRPNLRIEKPLELDRFFGLHPALEPILPSFREGKMAVVHAAGSADQSRSHFEAMSAMERGLPDAVSGAASGWLARYLLETQTVEGSPLRAVALGTMLPDSLRGGGTASALRSAADFRISNQRFEDLLRLAYRGGRDEAYAAGADTLKILKALKRIDANGLRAGAYPDSDLGEGLKQVSLLAGAEVGLEVACLDKGGWDTHVAQGGTTGWQASLLDDLAKSVAAFTKDMGERMSRTTIVVMTEFGRRAYENTGLGTDHGRASAMLLLGGGVQGGKVYGDWPGLEEHQLEDGDLRVTTDYRFVLAEVLASRMAMKEPERIFEGLGPGKLGLYE